MMRYMCGHGRADFYLAFMSYIIVAFREYNFVIHGYPNHPL